MAGEVPGHRDGGESPPRDGDRRDLVEVMRELAVLRDQGELSEAEFEQARKLAVEGRRPRPDQR